MISLLELFNLYLLLTDCIKSFKYFVSSTENMLKSRVLVESVLSTLSEMLFDLPGIRICDVSHLKSSRTLLELLKNDVENRTMLLKRDVAPKEHRLWLVLLLATPTTCRHIFLDHNYFPIYFVQAEQMQTKTSGCLEGFWSAEKGSLSWLRPH